VLANSMAVKKAIESVLKEGVSVKMAYDMTALYGHQMEVDGVVATNVVSEELQKRYGLNQTQSTILATAIASVVGSTPRVSSKAIGVLSNVPQVILNRLNGAAFERQVISAFDHVGGVKNTASVTVQLPNGAQVTTIPDLWGKNVGGILEVKNVKKLSMSNQLRAQVEIASETGQPLNLVVSPRTESVSKELLFQVRSTGGNVFKYNPSTGDLTNF
jgi:filamentous hemagglutinin